MRHAIQSACAALLALALSACSTETLYADLPEQQANEVHAALIAAGIDARKGPSVSKKGWAISLPRAQFASAMDTLRARGLPAPAYQSLGEVFAKEGITSSPIEDRARFIHAREQELARTLSEYDGVVAAHVHINLPAPDPLAEEKEGASASVVIFHLPQQTTLPSTQDIEAIVMDAIGVRPGSIGGEVAARPPRVTVRFAPRGQPALPTPQPVRAALVPGLLPALAVVLGALLAGTLGVLAWRRGLFAALVSRPGRTP